MMYVCKNCVFYTTYRDYYEDDEEPYDMGFCSIFGEVVEDTTECLGDEFVLLGG